MAVDIAKGRGHGDINTYVDVHNNGENFVLGSATEINSSGNPIMGTATVYVSNIWVEQSNAVPGDNIRIHFRVKAEWTADLDWQVTLVRFKHPGGPFG
jgi:hypothetical protein